MISQIFITIDNFNFVGEISNGRGLKARIVNEAD
jgi:hypothetical protein